MALTVVVLDNSEKFIQFLDTDLLDLEEHIEKNGLRTLKMEYSFQDFKNDHNELFRIGNKIWVQGDKHLTDCLYVINTEVTENIFEENKFILEVEEVLVELNYAQLFDQTQLNVKNNNNRYIFSKGSTNGQAWVKINWNSLNYWFGDYFNIGVVQSCMSDYASKISLNGTINLMSLLRFIEEETGNIFVTRYEKDCLDNTIHRYLDFLNPSNVNADWTLHMEYSFVEDVNITTSWKLDEPITDVTPFDDEDHELPLNYSDNEEDNEDWYDPLQDYSPMTNIDPDFTVFRISNNAGEVLNTDGLVFSDENDTPMMWDNADIGFNDNVKDVVFSLCCTNNNVGLTVNNKSFAVAPSENYVCTPKPCVDEINDETLQPVYIADDTDVLLSCAIPDDSYFEIYDTEHDIVVYRTQINNQIGHTHEEVLDFGFDMESVEFETNETETYTSISPVLSLSSNSGDSSQLTNSDMVKIVSDWKNLSVKKGDTIPMIVEKIQVQANGISNACDTKYPSVLLDKVKCKLGSFNKAKSPNKSMNVMQNYWSRPLKPQDNVNNTNLNQSTFEFWRGTAYWRAPFTKHKGHLEIETEATLNTQYSHVRDRPDSRNTRGTSISPKNGTVETSAEDVYAIYNAVAMELKEKQYPKFNITVDVANFKNGKFNNYNLHDKVYVKLPGNVDLVTARISKTVKNARDIGKNTVELDNYSINTVKTIQKNTYITCSNYSFHYPSSATLVARLINEDYNSRDEFSIQFPANRLLKLILYSVENGTRSKLIRMYTKITDKNGQVRLPLKYYPGNYEIDILYGGDEEYFECSHTVKINVSGQRETKQLQEKAKIKFKTTAKTNNNDNTTYTTKTTYWNRCGKSPITKKGQTPREVCAIARPSAGDGSYSYRWWKTVFKNKCPQCGKTGTLVYDSGTSRTKCIYCGPYNGSKRSWGNIAAECEISCSSCCSDFDGVTGLEKNEGHSTRLTTVKKPVPASYSDVAKLASGKLVYEQKKVKVAKKNVASSRTRKRICNSIPKTVVNKTLALIGDKVAEKAAKVICEFMGTKIGYIGYNNFQKSSGTVLNIKGGNCCDQTRLMLQMMDVAGLSEYYNMYYVHVSAGDRGHVFARLVTRKTGVGRYVDPCKSQPWANYVRGYGSPPGNWYKVTSSNLLNGIF